MQMDDESVLLKQDAKAAGSWEDEISLALRAAGVSVDDVRRCIDQAVSGFLPGASV